MNLPYSTGIRIKSQPFLLHRTQGDDYDAFIKVAQKSEDATFYETTDAAVAKAAGLSAPGVVVLTNFEGACSRACAGLWRLHANCLWPAVWRCGSSVQLRRLPLAAASSSY